MGDQSWYSVRCVMRTDTLEPGRYEERITLWRADNFEEAVRLAEDDAREYAATLGDGFEYLGLAQAYHLAGPPGHGAEVFSLIRESALEPQAYLDAMFQTGTEYAGDIPEDEPHAGDGWYSSPSS